MISSNSITLEPIGETHCKQTFAWVSQPYIQASFQISSPPTWETHVRYFPTLSAHGRKSFAILFEGKHVGNCGLKDCVPGESAELWIYIGEQSVYGRGVGTEATRQLVRFGFEELELKRIYLFVSDENEAARKMYGKLGFVDNGSPSGSWSGRQDMVRMELTRENG